MRLEKMTVKPATIDSVEPTAANIQPFDMKPNTAANMPMNGAMDAPKIKPKRAGLVKS